MGNLLKISWCKADEQQQQQRVSREYIGAQFNYTKQQ
jgi:hypothetical protein